MLTPRPYQSDQIALVRGALRQYRRVLLQCPTGGGKTVMATDMVSRSSSKVRAWFIVHRQELIDQSAATFDLAEIDYGYVAAGYRPDPFAAVQICSIDTLKRRYPGLKPPGIIFLDEAHHVGAKGWAAVMDAFPQAYIVGLSATPERLDGKGLDAQFDYMVRGPTVEWLINEGYLADYKIFTPAVTADLSGIHKRMGDFKRDELGEAMDKPTITGDAVKQYLKHARGKRAVAFCISVKHSEHVAESLRAAGVMSVHIDGKTPRDERRKAIQAFKDGHIKVLCNVDIVGEGLDLPALDAAILLRPTQSLALHLQQVGRCLRPKDGAKALILDHAGNWKRHGLPDDERNWSLKGKETRQGGSDDEAAIQVRQCSKCFAVHKPAPRCPECGFVYELKPREVDQVEGELEEVSKDELRRRARQEQGMAQGLDDLIALGKKRGYRHPEAWAAKIFTTRQRAGRGKRSRAEQQASLFGG